MRLVSHLHIHLKTLNHHKPTRYSPYSRFRKFLRSCQPIILEETSKVLFQLRNSNFREEAELAIIIQSMIKKEAIKGLVYRPEFISKELEGELTRFLLTQKWNPSLKRRTQHYGFTYSYDKTNQLEPAEAIPALFEVTKQSIEKHLHEQLGVECEFDQIIVNEYFQGQGISPHIDNTHLFGPIVVSLSLASQTIMLFQKKDKEKQQHRVQKLLERRSILILSQESRYKWSHSIPSRKSDHGVPRKTRYSLTFRTTIK